MNLANATVGQLLIPVNDLDRGVTFYRDVLGLQFIFAAPPQMAFFMCGTVRLLVGVTPAGQESHRGSAVRLNCGSRSLRTRTEISWRS